MFYGGIIIRVLIIEDDIITRTIQKGIVLEIASKVFEASDFFGGIDIIKKSNIDLVILDIGLNGEKDGIDFLKSIKKIYLADIKIYPNIEKEVNLPVLKNLLFNDA